jgi:hypothetical protein
MGSVGEPRYCANGERCIRYDSTSGRAQKLSRYNAENVCEACQREEVAKPETTPPAHAELFRVARLLFRAGVDDEGDIIPTLVFAANVTERAPLRAISNVTEMPQMRDIGDGLAILDDPDRAEIWKDLYDQVSKSFDSLVTLVGTMEGAQVLHLAPFRIILVTGGHEEGLEEVNIDVFSRCVQADDVAEKYEKYLRIRNVDVDPNRGTISYKVHKGFIRMLIRPETISVDRADGRILPLWSGPLRFPDPLVVAGMYSVLKGSRSKGKFKGFSSVLTGRERGPNSQIDTLILACVAWYLAGRGELIGQTEEKHRVVRMLNQELLGPCGKEPLPESSTTLWRNARNASDVIRRLELALRLRNGGVPLDELYEFS